MAKLKVGILGATGMVGQRMIQLLETHPWFEVSAVAEGGQGEHGALRGSEEAAVRACGS